jgi:hypothetical protein
MFYDYYPNKEATMELGNLLYHVPALVKAYGKWPSYAYLLFATARVQRVLLGGILLVIVQRLR